MAHSASMAITSIESKVAAIAPTATSEIAELVAAPESFPPYFKVWSNMPKMYLTTSAEAFMIYRKAISHWLFAKNIRVEVHLWSQSQRARILFENANDAWSFQEEFEGI